MNLGGLGGMLMGERNDGGGDWGERNRAKGKDREGGGQWRNSWQKGQGHRIDPRSPR